MKRNKSFLLLLPLVVVVTILVAIQFTSVAATTTITDTTVASAANDGTINAGEYIGCGEGIGSGFGDVIGSSGKLCVDSSDTGALNFGLVKGAGDLNDAVVIYIDSVAGGFGSTANFTDHADGLRTAISGTDGTNTSVMTFAPGFAADYVIAFSKDFGGLWQLAENGEHPFITSVNLTPTGTATSAGYEVNLLLSNIGVAQGGSFKFVATYISQSAYRSNEFQGTGAALDGPESGGNFGWNPVTLADGDYNVFVSVNPAELTATAGGATLTPTNTEIPATPTETATDIPTDVPTLTATATEPATVLELIDNGGFEAVDGNNKPVLAPWVAKLVTKDKIKCDTETKVVAYAGACAYQFKGGVGENSKLQQNLDIAELVFNVNDALHLSTFVKGSNAATAGKIKVVIKYADGASGKIIAVIEPAADYTELTGDYNLEQTTVTKIKVLITNKSTAGKLYLDEISLDDTVNALRSLIPLP